MSIPDIFHLKNCIYLFSKHTGHHILSLLALLNISTHEVCQNFGKKPIKILETGKFWLFCDFLCQFETFLFSKLQNSNYLFIKIYWSTNSYFDDRFQHSNSQSLSQLWQKLHENIETWKILGFLPFSVSVWDIFTFKTVILFSSKTTGQTNPYLCSLV